MVRFARKISAVGVKHREPEQATPWSQLKLTIQPRNYSVEEDEDYIEDNNLDGSEDDASGDEHEQQIHLISQPSLVEIENVELENEEYDSANANEDHDNLDDDTRENEDEVDNEIEMESEATKVDVLKRKHSGAGEETEKSNKKKRKKKSEKCKICGSPDHLKRFCEQLSEERRKELQDTYNAKMASITKEKKPLTALEKIAYAEKPKEKNKTKNNNKDIPRNFDKEMPRNFDKERPRKFDKFNENKFNHKEVKRDWSGAIVQEGERPRKFDKFNENKFNRKEIKRDWSGAIIQDGEAMFQGFRVTKEDKAKLTVLLKDLKTKGLTKAELAETMKRERRICEHRLARFNKLVCYKCMKKGHTIACCPEAGDRSSAPDSGICYKCGSLDHKSKECTSKGGGDFNFATCFICKQTGHLSRSCPNNQSGIYPQGGCCHYCGSVEHLGRDCHVRLVQQIRKGVIIGTAEDGNIEDVQPSGGVKHKNKRFKEVKKVQKVVKF